MRIDQKEVTIFPSKSAHAPLVILHVAEKEGNQVYQQLQQMTDTDVTLACIGHLDWNTDMSPWPAPALIKKEPLFSGGADAYIETLTHSIIPAIQQQLQGKPVYLAIAGYSLAGLFAIYSLYRTDAFQRAASVSGSMWYPDFWKFVQEQPLLDQPDILYFSLGDKEAKTRHPLLRTVQPYTENIYQFYKQKGIQTIFEYNPGNHFTEPAYRMAKGICRMLESVPYEN